jgi:hypothetical protein
MVGFLAGGKARLLLETMPDFLLLAREHRYSGWTVWRDYLEEGRIRRDLGFETRRQAREYAVSLTGGLLSPWVAVPHQATAAKDTCEPLLAFAKAQVMAETRA